MKFLNRYFFAGTAVGVVVGLVAGAAGVIVMGYFFSQEIARRAGVRQELVFPDSSSVTPLRPGADWQVHDLEGAPLSIAAQRGKVVFLNKWATWCGPCRREMPSIQALYDSLRTDGVVFVLVSDEDPAKVKRFVQRTGFTAPVYVADTKPPDAYESMGIPATYILDREGNVVADHIGSADWNVEACRSFLRRLTKTRS